MTATEMAFSPASASRPDGVPAAEPTAYRNQAQQTAAQEIAQWQP